MKPKLIIHTCCGPCSLTALERLKEAYDLVLYFYNPNIQPEEEYIRRRDAARQCAEIYGIPFEEGPYEPEKWLEMVKGMEDEPEGGKRCALCFKERLQKTAEDADENAFTTTLTVSPHKPTDKINQIGETIAREMNVPFKSLNLKKEDGYKLSVDLSKKYGIYRQNYCGCSHSQISRSSTD